MKFFIKTMFIIAIINFIGVNPTVAQAPVQEKPPTPQEYAKELVTKKWGESYWLPMERIISKESDHWRVTTAHYPSGYTVDGIKSSAYGLCGFLDGTWEGTGYIKTDNPYVQLEACMIYTENRYGNPQVAWDFHVKKNYW